MFMTVYGTSKTRLKLCVQLWLLSETANHVYPSWWPNFHCCIFQANKHILLNGCLSVRSVSTSTSHRSRQFPFTGGTIRESKMAADPKPQTQRNALAESTNQQQQVSGSDSLSVCTIKWAGQQKKSGMSANHRSKTKRLFVRVIGGYG